MPEEGRSIQVFWDDLPFFATRVEQFVARRWILIVLLPYLTMLAWGFGFDQGASHSLYSVTVVARDPFLSSLGIGLVVSAIAFTIWQTTMRRTFSAALESGIVADAPTSIQKFMELSLELKARLHSPWRYVVIAAVVLLTLTISNVGAIGLVPLTIRDWPPPPEVFFSISMEVELVIFAYAVGAVAWCLTSAALWMVYAGRKLRLEGEIVSRVSSGQTLRIQPGHSDGCCGLESIGSCCLQSAIPLLIGMVLCLIWSNSRRLPIFRSEPAGFLDLIVPFSDCMVAALLLLACAIVFLPVKGLHAQMESYKSAKDAAFTKELEIELQRILQALASDDKETVRSSADRLRLVQALDPVALKLSTWPFDKASLLKYAIAPFASVAGSFGKEAVMALWK